MIPIRALLIAVLCTLAAGCRSSVSALAMTPEGLTFDIQHFESLWIEVSTPPRLLSFSPPRVPQKAVETALRNALSESELFKLARTTAAADYRLQVSFVRIEEPEAGLDMTAHASAKWVLIEGPNDKVVWRRTVTTEHRATSDDSAFIEERGRMALEGALRENITEGIELLGREAL